MVPRDCPEAEPPCELAEGLLVPSLTDSWRYQELGDLSTCFPSQEGLKTEVAESIFKPRVNVVLDRAHRGFFSSED